MKQLFACFSLMLALARPSSSSSPTKNSRTVLNLRTVHLVDQRNKFNEAQDSDDLFVRFRHGSDDREVTYESQVLQKPGQFFSDIMGKAVVSSEITECERDDNPETLFCTIVQRKRRKSLMMSLIKGPFHGKERILASAEFKPDDLQLACENASKDVLIRVPMRLNNGRSCPERFVEIEAERTRWIKEYTDASIENDTTLEPFFQLTSTFFKRSIENTNNLKAFELPRPADEANPKLKMVAPLKGLEGFRFPENDEFEPVGLNVLLPFRLINSIPRVRDQLTRYKNRSDAIAAVRNTIGNSIPAPKEGHWKTPTSDSSMKRIFFSSVGSLYIKKLPGFEEGFVADFTDLDKYAVRTKKQEYEPFGCKTYFDPNGNIVKIVETNGEVHEPGSEHWVWAKLKSRSAVFIKAAFSHFGEVHYVWGNHGASSLRFFLSPNHPLRRAFTPHFYKTHHTCRRAQYSLFEEKGILGRGMSLDYKEGLEKVYVDYIGGFKYKDYIEELKEQNVLDCKFHVGATDGRDLHKIIREYVSDLFDETYLNDEEFKRDEEFKQAHEYLVKELSVPDRLKDYTFENAKEIWGEIIFRCTGYHNAIGAVTAFGLDPAMVNIRLQPKGASESEKSRALLGSKESAIGIALISAITQVPCPTLGQCWKQVLEDPNCKSYATLRKKLTALENTIDIRNTVRENNVDFHPQHCAISISS